MAVVKAAKGGASLNRAVDYIERKSEISSGKDCPSDREQAKEQMQLTKELWEQEDGRQYKHYIQSFDPKDNDRLTPEKAHEIGREWAEKNFPGHEVYISTHADKEHVHNHFVVNSVNFETGRKLQVSKHDLQEMKRENDILCRREGLSVPEKALDREIRSFDQAKYQLLQRVANGENVKSHVLETALAVEKAAQKAHDRESFISEMKERNYDVSWKDNHKHVTFEDQEGHKVRLANLEKTFKQEIYSKEGLEREFERTKDREREAPEHKRGLEEGLGKLSPERALDRVHGAIREIEDRAKEFSPAAREKSKQLEREQRELTRHNNERGFSIEREVRDRGLELGR